MIGEKTRLRSLQYCLIKNLAKKFIICIKYLINSTVVSIISCNFWENVIFFLNKYISNIVNLPIYWRINWDPFCRLQSAKYIDFFNFLNLVTFRKIRNNSFWCDHWNTLIHVQVCLAFNFYLKSHGNDYLYFFYLMSF